jgi:hypothetical protein
MTAKIFMPRRVAAHEHTADPEPPHTGRSPFTVTRVPARVCGQ